MNKKIVYTFLVFQGVLFSDNRDIPEFDVITNNNPYPSNIFVHSMGNENYMTILDTSLQTYWQINSLNMGIDFKKNSDHITYFKKYTSDSGLSGPVGPAGEWIKADHVMQENDTMQCTSGLTDYHDIRLLDNGNYIIQAYDSLYVNMQELIEGGYPYVNVRGILRLQEFDQNHNLLFNWFALDHLNIADYGDYINLVGPEITWMHGNSIEVDDDQNLIISNRRSSEIIKIHRDSGEIIWIFGGPLNEFQITDDPLNGFSKQHDARRLENGNLLIFDNGNQHSPPLSRVIEYEIDEINKTALLVWEFINPDNHVSLSMGSAQRLPNQNTLINWGNLSGVQGANIMEVDYDQNIVLELQFQSHNAYKVRKHDWQFDIPMQIGDANLDDIVNILDVLYLVNHVLDNNSPNNIFNLYKIDFNRDNEIDILDIVEMVNIILS